MPLSAVELQKALCGRFFRRKLGFRGIGGRWCDLERPKLWCFTEAVAAAKLKEEAAEVVFRGLFGLFSGGGHFSGLLVVAVVFRVEGLGFGFGGTFKGLVVVIVPPFSSPAELPLLRWLVEVVVVMDLLLLLLSSTGGGGSAGGGDGARSVVSEVLLMISSPFNSADAAPLTRTGETEADKEKDGEEEKPAIVLKSAELEAASLGSDLAAAAAAAAVVVVVD